MSALPGSYLSNNYSVQNEYIFNNCKKLLKYKLILVGEAAVGKTSIISRFVNNQFDKKYKCTIGSEFKLKTFNLEDYGIQMEIYDTCGTEKFRAITRQYYRNTDGIFLIFDLTNPISFTKLDDWIVDIKNSAPRDSVIFVIGNKKDLEDARNVSKWVIENNLRKNKIDNYFETSALTGDGVELTFKAMAKVLLEKDKLNKLLEQNNKNNDNNNNIEDDKKSLRTVSSTYSSSTFGKDKKNGCC